MIFAVASRDKQAIKSMDKLIHPTSQKTNAPKFATRKRYEEEAAFCELRLYRIPGGQLNNI